MIDFVLYFLVQIILNPIGGAIRWAVFRKKPLKKYVADGWEDNILALGTLCGIIGIIFAIAENI